MVYHVNMKDWKKVADKNIIEEVINNLKNRNIDVYFVETSEDAKNKVLELIPQGARVLASQSETLNQTGIAQEIENSDNFVSVRKEYMALDKESQAVKIRELRSTPQFIVGSVHAVTQAGEVLIASNSGSQIAAYVYSAEKVIWVIGAQKIVKDIEEGNRRIYDYVLPLESERLNKLYGIPSNVSKLVVYTKEPVKDRVTAIIVNEALGF